MSVALKRVIPRIAGCCVLVLLAAAFAPSAIPADAVSPPQGDSVSEPDGLLCMDNMETEPFTDDAEPLPVSHVDGGCSVTELPVST